MSTLLNNSNRGRTFFEFVNSDTAIFLLYIFWFLSQLPFLSSALRVDEPYYVWVADHISEFPWDPYGGKINWYGSPQRAFETLPNPPLVPCLLAIWQRLFSSTETSVHGFALAFSFLALYGFALVARSVKVNRLSALSFLLCSPGFYLGSQVAFLDIPMLALLLVALGHSWAFSEKGTPSALWIAFAAAFLCPLAKYAGVMIGPLVVCLAFVSNRKRGIFLIATAPFLSILIWNLFCWLTYGDFHWTAVRRFQTIYGQELPLLTGLGLLARFGLGVLPLTLALPLVTTCCSRRFQILDLASLLCVYWLGRQVGLEWMSGLLLAISITLAMHAICRILITGYKSLKTGDDISGFLAIWATVALLFQLAMPYTCVRYLVPAAPPVILLFLRHWAWGPPRRVFLAASVANFLFVTCIAIGDSSIAEGYRKIVNDTIAPHLSATTNKFYFSGHWGFQYYAQLAGGQVIDKRQEPQYKDGDLIVIPRMGIPDIDAPKLSAGLEAMVNVVSQTPRWPIRTVDVESGANFYGSWTHGSASPTLLPFGFSTGPSDTFRLYRVSKVKN